ncbi:ABC transporter permease [Lactonifactor longoviformis]
MNMKGLRYQLKSVRKDKFCLMTFLLPILAAAALHYVGSIDLTSLGELQFGILRDDMPEETAAWLEGYGTVTAYPSLEELINGIREPSTNLIGVEADGNGIQTICAGDELDIFRQTADTLPALYEQRNASRRAEVQILERPGVMAGLQDMFITVTLIIAMFMGCTYNAMNMVSEKEDGVALINEILPITRSQYILQKIIVGFLCGCLSSILTACICFRLSLQNAVLMLILILLSSFVAALIGLFVGRLSRDLMMGVVYIKVIMLLFMAVPILCFLVGVSHPFLSAVCYLIPSQAAFEGIMDLTAGSTALVTKDIFILLFHCAGWFLLYIEISLRRKKHA